MLFRIDSIEYIDGEDYLFTVSVLNSFLDKLVENTSRVYPMELKYNGVVSAGDLIKITLLSNSHLNEFEDLESFKILHKKIEVCSDGKTWNLADEEI